MKKICKLFMAFCFIAHIIFNTNGMDLTNALTGKEKIQIMTLVRSCSNSMVFRAERAIIQNLLDNNPVHD